MNIDISKVFEIILKVAMYVFFLVGFITGLLGIQFLNSVDQKQFAYNSILFGSFGMLTGIGIKTIFLSEKKQ